MTSRPVPPPTSRGPDVRTRGSTLSIVWGVVIGMVLGVLVLLALLAATKQGPLPGPDGGNGPTPTGTVSPDVAEPVGDEPIPGVGGDVFIAGGLTRVPVPQGWTLLTRGNRADDPGGYSESAVLTNRKLGVTLGVYLQAGTTSPGDATSVADAGAREWTRDGTAATFESARTLDPFGGVTGAALVRFRYARGTSLQGEVVAAVRQNGQTLVVIIEGPEGALESARGAWQPLRDSILTGFGG